MGGRFSRSMKLFSASWGVLREDKALAVFPVISALCGLVIMATFAVPILFFYVHSETTSVYSQVQGLYVNQTTLHLDPAGWIVMGLGYFVLIYVGIFCNAALIFAANEKLTGTGPGTVASGFQGASAKAGAFVPWAMLSATVTVLLRAAEERMGIIGKIAISLIGIAWTLVTFLVVPVLVLEEGMSTGKAISRSATLFKGTWGENVIGNAGFGLVSMVAMIPAFVLFIVGLVSGMPAIMVLFAVLAVLWILVASQVIAALSGIYRVALYRYAVDGQPPAAYTMIDFHEAFRPKKSSGLFSSTRSQTIYRSSPQETQQAQQRQRDAWKAWEPPPPEQVDGSFGIEIPGADPLSQAGPSAPPPPPPEVRPDDRPQGPSPWAGGS